MRVRIFSISDLLPPPPLAPGLGPPGGGLLPPEPPAGRLPSPRGGRGGLCAEAVTTRTNAKAAIRNMTDSEKVKVIISVFILR